MTQTVAVIGTPDVSDIFSMWFQAGLDNFFEISLADRIVMGLAVILAVTALILMIRWVD